MIRLLALMGITIVLLASCGRRPEPSVAPPPTSSSATRAPQTTAPAVSHEPGLADGIDFTQRPEYPAFIRSVSGMSGYEATGRWTEGPRAVFSFAEPLPRRFLLKIEFAGAFGPNVGKPVKVRAGDWEGQFTVEVKPKTVELPVSTSSPAEAIEFLIPSPASPMELGMSTDTRKVGIMFVRMRVVPT